MEFILKAMIRNPFSPVLSQIMLWCCIWQSGLGGLNGLNGLNGLKSFVPGNIPVAVSFSITSSHR